MADIFQTTISKRGSTMLNVSRILMVFLVGFFLVCGVVKSVRAQTAISYGDTIEGAIEPAGDEDDYTFNASSGDTVTVCFKKTSGTFSARAEIYDPSETLVEDGASSPLEASLTENGTYTIKMKDYWGDRTGNYTMSLQCVTDPVNATNMTFGDAYEGSIEYITSMAPYVFLLNTNDILRVNAGEVSTTSGSFSTRLYLYDPDGTQVASTSSSTLTEKVSETGQYCLMVSDSGFDGTGTFSVSAQLVNNPVEAVNISLGSYAEGVIEEITSSKAHQISLTAGDAVSLRIGEVAGYSGTFNTRLEFFAPNGTSLGVTTSDLEETVPVSGSYCALAWDNGCDGTGVFSLGAQRLNNPVNATSVDFGQTITGSIDSYAHMQPYTFNASVNDTVKILSNEIIQQYGTFSPYLELYNETGECIAYTYGNKLDEKLNVAGQYTLMVTDHNLNGKGTYEFTLQRANNPVDVVDLTMNEKTDTEIPSATAMQAYRFTAGASEDITVCSEAVTQYGICENDLRGFLELYNASGFRLDYGLKDLSYTFSSGGTYCLFISDYGTDAAGSLRFIMRNITVSCGSIDLIDPEVTLESPLAGAVIENGSFCNITWSSSDTGGIESHQVRLSTDSGQTYATVIASNLSGAVKSYNWSVPANLTTTRARIKVIAVDENDNQGEDANKGDFIVINTTLPANMTDMTYRYDSGNRLVESSDVTTTCNYTYDALGNRLNLTVY